MDPDRAAAVEARDRGRAGCRRKIAGQNAHGRGLARAVRPQESQDLALLDLERHVVHGDHVPVALSEILNLDHSGNLAPDGMESQSGLQICVKVTIARAFVKYLETLKMGIPRPRTGRSRLMFIRQRMDGFVSGEKGEPNGALCGGPPPDQGPEQVRGPGDETRAQQAASLRNGTMASLRLSIRGLILPIP